MVVYYSGTGNSEHIAKIIAKKLDDEAVSAFEYIRSGSSAVLHSQKPWVFVSPVYVSAPPRVFMDFIKSAKLSGNQKAWFVYTCAGGFGACPAYSERLCKATGLRFMGAAQIQMPQNYLVFFKTREKSECGDIIAAGEKEAERLAEFIREFRAFPDPGMKGWELVSTDMIIEPYYRFFITAKGFRVTDKCIGCGKCERSCPLGNISLTDKKPVWGDKCTHCMACIGGCPVKAIEYKKSENKAKYHF